MNIAIIPARGGSKRIPRKNIRNFLGKPIIAYSIETAIKSNLFDEIMVSTDDKEIASVTLQYGAKVPFIRSAQNANDYATVGDVVTEVLDWYTKTNKEFDNICCILPTAPFISVKNISESYQMLSTGNYDSVFPVVRFSYPIQRALRLQEGLISMFQPENFPKRSQDLEPAYHDSGTFYWMKTNEFLKQKRFFAENSGALILPETQVQDIDSDEDWILAELKYKMLNINE